MGDEKVRIDDISVQKRNGKVESFNIDKIHKMVERACEGLSGVSVSDIEMQAHLSFFNGMSTTDIHRSLTKAAADLISENSPNYQYVAGRLLNYDIRKSAWGGMNPPRLYDHVKRMIETGYYSEDVLSYYTEEEWDKLDGYIDHDRDLNMVHIGVTEYLTKYAVRDRSLKQVFPLETPQLTYMIISAVLFAEDKSIKAVKSYYNDISTHNISLPTPIMAGIRTPTKQGSSCVLISCGDTLNSIISTTGAIVKYISKKAGIGIDASAIRAEGSSVGTEKSIKHTGVIPYFKLFESAVKSCSQGGVRGGSATLYTALWHLEIEDILVLKNNKGTQDNRVRKIDYGIQINNYLYNRFIKNQDITLFSPHEVRDLYAAFFADQKKFAELYEAYEKNDNVRKKKVNARELFVKLMTERKETGRIYIFNVDNANDHSSFTVPITQSNLCAEITLPTKPLKSLDDPEGEIALCSLSAINLGNIKSFDDLESICKNAVRGLDNLLSYQDYMVPAAKTSTMNYRPLGVGVINLAYYLAKNGYKYSDPEAHKLIHDTMEAIQYYCIKASVELAKEKGSCLALGNTKYGQGLLPIDHYNKNVDDIVTPKYNLNWEWLRKELKKYGIRNATLTALMPAETSAKISNATNGVEPVRSLITTKSNKANVSRQVVPEYSRLKNKYDLLWDMQSNEGVIKSMAVIQKFVDQSISTNNNYNPAHYPNNEIPMSVLLKDLLMCNKYGLKTLYYLNTNDQRDIELKEVKVEAPVEEEIKEDDCDSCKI
jgi:ribonucleoside-diphosphate reductase alpha chain